MNFDVFLCACIAAEGLALVLVWSPRPLLLLSLVVARQKKKGKERGCKDNFFLETRVARSDFREFYAGSAANKCPVPPDTARR